MNAYPGTNCSAKKAWPTRQEHYVREHLRQDWDREGRFTLWGYCADCGNIVTFVKYQLRQAVTTILWTDYHHPIIEWP